ncbi:MAG: hypothetical protein HDR23_01800 [Lachnospiraceae bacterium]|nr:hypothetical protein [Lachnospiraceae bacterium]MBD5455205.1 hypothetical protein [Lachnospiraceae bacterium]
MLSGYQTEEELIQNMVDAGCEENMAASILICLKQGQKKKGLLLLQEQRKMLLGGIHRNRSCIEFLDDVLCGMRKESKG